MDPSEPPPTPSPTTDPALALLRERFGHAAFREGQAEAVRSALAGRSLLVVMPTGSGKSLLYQLPALLGDGLTLVVSPLIALMKDQVDDLQRRNVPATFINSSLGMAQQQSRMADCVAGRIRLLYVAPERFQNAAFLNMLRQVKVARMAVDEAHCISEWGHDFRPDYRRLKAFRHQAGDPPATALTATATPRVQADIVTSLGLDAGEVDVHVHGFDRPNLALSVFHARDDDTKRAFVREFLGEERGPGIIYVGTRRTADDLAGAVADVEPKTVVYHAGLEPEERTRAQESFLRGEARVAIATVAFGMGIDKADVRFVLHYHYPGSVEAYYQEIGRAGRDGRPARCPLLVAPADRSLRQFFIDLSYPTREQVRSVYRAIWSVPESPLMLTYAEIADLCDEKVREGQVASAVRLLDGAGVTRAMAGEATAAVRLDQPGAQVLPRIRGKLQRTVFEALAASFDLETPGRYAVELVRIAADARVPVDRVRRALAALAEAGHIGYDPPFRGRGIEKRVDPPPPFAKVPIDWKRQDFLRRIEEERLEAMETYIHETGCRRGYILAYFGEKNDLVCGTCDNCEPGGGAAASRGGILVRHPDVAGTVLLCISHLRFPLGILRTIQVVTGSREKNLLEWGLDKNPAYGRLRGMGDLVRHVVDDLLKEGYLKREGDFARPVVALTPLGARAAAKVTPDAPFPAPAAAAGRKDTRAAGGDEPSIRQAVLECVAALRPALGVSKIVEVLTGSRAAWVARMRADRLAVYGTVGAKRETVRMVIEAMLAEGLLDRDPSADRPVVELTDAGCRELQRLRTAAPETDAVAEEVLPVHEEAPGAASPSGVPVAAAAPPDPQIAALRRRAYKALLALENDPSPDVRRYASQALADLVRAVKTQGPAPEENA